MTTATPRQRLSAEQRRDQLMNATVELLAAHGYGGVTAGDIALRAGVSKGLLWHYFTDLDELYELTARRTLLSLRSAVAATLDLAAPAPQVIRAAVLGAAALRVTHGTERRAMQEIVLNLRRPDGSLRLGVQDYDETYEAQAAIFRRGQQQGDIRTDLDPVILAVSYQGAVDGMLGYLDTHPDADPERFATTVADVLLEGVSTSPDDGGAEPRFGREEPVS